MEKNSLLPMTIEPDNFMDTPCPNFVPDQTKFGAVLHDRIFECNDFFSTPFLVCKWILFFAFPLASY